jgi:hypothetical protein
MPIIATLHPDGQTIAKATIVRVIPGQAQGFYAVVTFPELRQVRQVLHVELTTSPKTWVQSHNLQDKTYLGNTVGFSMYLDVAAGTTLTAEVVAIGF